jgi:3-isopropylmalate dehydrogenase
MMGRRRRCVIATIPGDGIGPEVLDAALPAIGLAAVGNGAEMTWERLPLGADHYLATGETLPDDVFDRLKANVDAIMVGALGDPRIPGNEHARDILLGLRVKLDLYVNFRPCRLLHPDLCPLKAASEAGDRRSLGGRRINFTIFRENTEGMYLGRGRSSGEGTPAEERIAEEIHTASKVERIVRAAFEWARANGRRRITMCDKSNAVPAHHLWQRLFGEIGPEYPELECEHRYVDALVMELVRTPERFEIIVTNNLFGDIISDLGAELVGGLGLAPSANLHPGRPGLFEPVHGSAPSLAGKGIANPMAAVLTGALMLENLGLGDGARRLVSAVERAVAEGVTTPDIGGTASTADVGRFLAQHAAGSP